jgi:hypothetical protein
MNPILFKKVPPLWRPGQVIERQAAIHVTQSLGTQGEKFIISIGFYGLVLLGKSTGNHGFYHQI